MYFGSRCFCAINSILHFIYNRSTFVLEWQYIRDAFEGRVC